MPGHTPTGGLAKQHGKEGRPWIWVRWQELTGVHFGLFPADDGRLPDGWDRATSDEVAAFFDRFERIPTEEERIKFVSQRKGGHEIPGRGKFTSWVNALWKKCKMNDIIIKVLRQEELHPVNIMVALENLDDWPAGDSWIPLALDAVGLELFGPEAMTCNGRLGTNDRNCVQIFIQRTWGNIRKTVIRSKVRIVTLERAALASFAGMCH